MKPLSNKEFEDILKILERQFSTSVPEGSTRIALGEALTELYDREHQLGEELVPSARRAFLYTTAKNKILNEIRAHKKLTPLENELTTLETMMELADTTFEITESQKMDVAKALDLLTEKRREVMVMKYIEGYTEKQIAEKLGISIYTVEERLKKAKKELRKKLRDEGK